MIKPPPPKPDNLLAAFGIIAGLVLACALGFLASSNAPRRIESFPPFLVAPRDPAAATPFEHHTPCKHYSRLEESDLCAQWRAASAATDSAFWGKVGSFTAALSTLGVVVALWLAFGANRIAQKTANQQLRAYVAIENIVLVIPIIGSPYAEIKVKNFGQTPAHNFDIVSYLQVHHGPWDEKMLITNTNSRPVPSSLAPSAHSVAYPELGRTLHAFEKVALANGTARIYVTGYIDYEDVFGEIRRTSFLVYNRGPAGQVTTIHAAVGNYST